MGVYPSLSDDCPFILMIMLLKNNLQCLWAGVHPQANRSKSLATSKKSGHFQNAQSLARSGLGRLEIHRFAIFVLLLYAPSCRPSKRKRQHKGEVSIFSKKERGLSFFPSENYLAFPQKKDSLSFLKKERGIFYVF